LHAIIARNGLRGIVIRRGPSKTARTFLWDLRSDEFTAGDKLKGRIYERRCDISPDGKHFIYFAYNGRTPTRSWTAISRVPNLEPIASVEGQDCWNGGGLFSSNSTFWHNKNQWEDGTLSVPGFHADEEFPFHENYGGECPGVYYIRLQREGWELSARRAGKEDFELTTFIKNLPKGWILEKTTHATINSPEGKGCYYDTHRLLHPETSIVLDQPNWEWADLHDKRVVWAEKGMIHASNLERRGLKFVRTLHDFNPVTD
jgi:hypothetical protein